MTAVVSVETMLLVVLIVLVAGLLRSHAEILRRLGPPEVDGQGQAAAPAPSSRPRRETGASAPALAGTTPAGDAVHLSFDSPAAAPTLLAFLTSGCTTCAGFWESLGENRLPRGVRTVIVARGAEREQPARLRALAPAGVPVVMSSEAWHDFDVPGAPYFVLVDETIRGEGVATSWRALSSLVGDALEDQRVAAEEHAGERRARTVEETLAAAGIGPDHPSLHPAGKGGQ